MRHGAAFIRQGLVVTQFAVSIVLIISTVIVYQQIQHIKSRQLGFNKDNLVEMDLEVMAPGLLLSGTNQRFGARGMLRVLPDSKLQLRNNEFLVREGFVRCDDPNKIVPKVDVRAQTTMTSLRRALKSGTCWMTLRVSDSSRTSPDISSRGFRMRCSSERSALRL